MIQSLITCICVIKDLTLDDATFITIHTDMCECTGKLLKLL